MRESRYWPTTNTGRAKALVRSLTDDSSGGRVTSRIGYTRRDGVRVVRRWGKNGEMIETEMGQTGTYP